MVPFFGVVVDGYRNVRIRRIELALPVFISGRIILQGISELCIKEIFSFLLQAVVQVRS